MPAKLGCCHGTSETGHVPPAESTKDYWSHMERQGNQHRSIDIRIGQKRLHDTVEERRLRFAGHVIWMASERPANHAMD